ncbi:uncharacterized protein V6R79_023123 [Siganus canaliculatus]
MMPLSCSSGLTVWGLSPQATDCNQMISSPPFKRLQYTEQKLLSCCEDSRCLRVETRPERLLKSECRPAGSWCAGENGPFSQTSAAQYQHKHARASFGARGSSKVPVVLKRLPPNVTTSPPPESKIAETLCDLTIKRSLTE